MQWPARGIPQHVYGSVQTSTPKMGNSAPPLVTPATAAKYTQKYVPSATSTDTAAASQVKQGYDFEAETRATASGDELDDSVPQSPPPPLTQPPPLPHDWNPQLQPVPTAVNSNLTYRQRGEAVGGNEQPAYTDNNGPLDNNQYAQIETVNIMPQQATFEAHTLEGQAPLQTMPVYQYGMHPSNGQMYDGNFTDTMQGNSMANQFGINGVTAYPQTMPVPSSVNPGYPHIPGNFPQPSMPADLTGTNQPQGTYPMYNPQGMGPNMYGNQYGPSGNFNGEAFPMSPPQRLKAEEMAPTQSAPKPSEGFDHYKVQYMRSKSPTTEVSEVTTGSGKITEDQEYLGKDPANMPRPTTPGGESEDDGNLEYFKPSKLKHILLFITYKDVIV